MEFNVSLHLDRGGLILARNHLLDGCSALALVKIGAVAWGAITCFRILKQLSEKQPREAFQGLGALVLSSLAYSWSTSLQNEFIVTLGLISGAVQKEN